MDSFLCNLIQGSLQQHDIPCKVKYARNACITSNLKQKTLPFAFALPHISVTTRDTYYWETKTVRRVYYKICLRRPKKKKFSLFSSIQSVIILGDNFLPNKTLYRIHTIFITWWCNSNYIIILRLKTKKRSKVKELFYFYFDLTLFLTTS